MSRQALIFSLTAATALACGDRPTTYDAPLGPLRSFGLEDTVVIVDDGAHRAVVLSRSRSSRTSRARRPRIPGKRRMTSALM